MRTRWLAALVLGAVMIVDPAPAVAAGAGAPVVVTDGGPVRGVLGEDHRRFDRIPFAAPPVGELRWASPRPRRPWTAPRDATQPATACTQLDFQSGEVIGGEDCLYLNVTTPRHAAGRRLPVMVWFHGGAFQFGTAAEFGPRELAARGEVVVVTVNYRLGVFGFLDHPALDGGLARARSGNFGLEDQQRALRWVRRNAEAFGGDPLNVTIFGESSGARSVCAQLVSPAAAGLFHRAIIQSEPCNQTEFPRSDGSPDPAPPGFPLPRADAEAVGVELAASLDCGDAATAAVCLREKAPAALMEQAGQIFFAPVLGGGGVLPIDPAEAITAGRFARVPVMHGITRDEYRVADAFNEVLFGQPPLCERVSLPDCPAGYVERVTAWVGEEHAAEVLRRYPVGDSSPSEAWAAVITDATWARPAVDLARDLARRVPTYAFEFADRSAPWRTGLAKPSFPTGAYHESELQYLFEVDGFAEPLTAAQQRLSTQMIRYWTRFAHTGNPNGPGSPVWPRADHGTNLAQAFAPGSDRIRPVNVARQHNYDFWRSITR